MGWGFPRRFGARDRTRDVAHRALLEALAPGFDITQGTALWAETRAEAQAIATMWSVNARVGNQLVPARMLDVVRTYEEACGLRPLPGDTANRRRAAIEARLISAAGNRLNDIATIAATVMGAGFVAILKPAVVVSYWPGVNPGPPGFEFTSNRAVICLKLSRAGVSDDEFTRRQRDLVDQLDRIVPAWMRIVTGEGDEFIADIGIADITLL